MKITLSLFVFGFLATSALANLIPSNITVEIARKKPLLQQIKHHGKHRGKYHGKHGKPHNATVNDFHRSSGGKSWAFSNFNKCTAKNFLDTWGVTKDSYGEENRHIVKDPAGGNDLVLRLTYPKGSYNPQGNPVGGTGIYASPIKIPAGNPTVTFSYDVFFPKGFKFNMGGKLPGLYAGHDHCSGGNPATDCFSTRFMWRKGGMGELYAYIPDKGQNKNLCKGKGDFCNPDYGNSLDRGIFNFKTGKWNSLKLVVKPNSKPKSTTGHIDVWYENKHIMHFADIEFTLRKGINILGLDFESFFGGHDDSWATPTTQYTYFRNLRLSFK